ncbi:MAG: hypothetical protein VX834_05860 [Myxococcota bacterium]|nr:hypothetical protein [Myxococcota bacterium]
MKTSRFGLYIGSIALVLAFLSAGCSEEETKLTTKPDWICEEDGGRPGLDDSPCSGGKRFVKGECVEMRCDAGDLAPNCCPGLFCDAGGTCQIPASRIAECASDEDCPTGQACLDRPRITTEASTTTLSCGWPSVDAAGSCPNGGTPFNQRCVAEAPCGGSCPSGQVCNIDTNVCETTPTLADDTTCSQTCGESEVLVYADPDSMLFGQCCAVSCECLTLPGLEPGAWGRFSDIQLDGDSIHVSAYDTTYGDLIFATHGSVSASLESIDYVDGVPTSGSVVADPAGPRGGRIEAGEDVGQHTALAMRDGTAHIAYYDVDNQVLKYASGNRGQFTTMTLDESAGDVGRYSSIAVDNQGRVHVSYYAHRATIEVDGTSREVTGPMYARSKTPAPASASDWDIIPIEQVASCGNSCGPTQACVDSGGPTCVAASEACESCECGQLCVNGDSGPTCLAEMPRGFSKPCGGSCPDGTVCVSDGATGNACLSPAVGCEQECGTGEQCVDDGSGAVSCALLTPYSGIEGYLEGVGLFTSLAIQNDNPVVVYYDSIRGHLRGAIAQFTTAGALSSGFAVGPVACHSGDDVGQHASLAVSSSGTVGVAYQALAGETLWAFTGADIFDAGGTHVEVDDGFRASSIHLVGAGADAAFTGSDELVIAYGDQTENDLVLAFPDGESWGYSTLLSDGAYGTFPALVVDGDRAWVATYKRAQDSSGDDISELVIHVTDVSSLSAE